MSHDAAAGPGTPNARAEVRKSIVRGSSLSGPYLAMNALATVVASYGLLADSPAVVIGAMIIAMLLGPIMGLALAIVDGDIPLLQRAGLAEAVGAVMVVAIAWMIGGIHHNIDLTQEILVRTRPNLADLMIALAGGAAGAFATVSPRVSVGLVGVAISTALVPPLASCGICLSRGLLPQAGGAFLLFATNLVAIQAASSLVLFAAGYHLVTEYKSKDKGYLHRILIDGALLLVLGVFLYVQLGKTVTRQRYERTVKETLAAELVGLPGAFLFDTRFVVQGKQDIVVAVVTCPVSITPQQTARLESALRDATARQVQLHVRSQLVKETTAEGYLHIIEPEAAPIDQVGPPVPSPSSNLGGQPDDPQPALGPEGEGPIQR